MNINIGLGDTTTLYSTTLSTVDSDNKVRVDRLSTTATSIGTTLSASGVDDVHIQLNATRNYVSQMSTEEIDNLLNELDKREVIIQSPVEDDVKVKTIGVKKI